MKAVVVLCMLLGVACAQNQGGAAAEPAAPETTAGAGGEDEIVCREERATGSMISNKVCRKRRDNAGDQVDRFTRGGGRSGGG